MQRKSETVILRISQELYSRYVHRMAVSEVAVLELCENSARTDARSQEGEGQFEERKTIIESRGIATYLIAFRPLIEITINEIPIGARVRLDIHMRPLHAENVKAPLLGKWRRNSPNSRISN